MAPFHMPWSTFTAFLVLGGTIALALNASAYAGRDAVLNEIENVKADLAETV